MNKISITIFVKSYDTEPMAYQFNQVTKPTICQFNLTTNPAPQSCKDYDYQKCECKDCFYSNPESNCVSFDKHCNCTGWFE